MSAIAPSAIPLHAGCTLEIMIKIGHLLGDVITGDDMLAALEEEQISPADLSPVFGQRAKRILTEHNQYSAK